MKDEAPSPRVRYAFAAIAATAAALVVVGVFVGLPARWSVVDVPAALLAAVEMAAAVFLVRWRPVSRRVIRAASAVVLAFGLLGLAAVFPAVVKQQTTAKDSVQGVSVLRSAEGQRPTATRPSRRERSR